jgi:hypothetical protein
MQSTLTGSTLGHLTSHPHQLGVYQLSEPNIVLWQIVQLPAQLHSEVIHFLLMRDLNPE